MPDFEHLSPPQQRKELLSAVMEHCPGAVWEGDALHYPGQALRVALEFGQTGSQEDRFSAQLLFILHHDWFDEELVESCASIGHSLEEAMKACAEEFSESVLKSVLASFDDTHQETFTADVMNEKHIFHVPDEIPVMHKGKGAPADLFGIIKDKISGYLGKKRAYWVKLYSADMGDKQFCEARINGVVYPDLTDLLYQEIFRRSDRQISIDKLFLLFTQDSATFKPCPFTKQNVGELTFMTLDLLKQITDETSRQNVTEEIRKFCPEYSIFVELISFLPEIAAQKIVDFRDNDGLIPVINRGKPEFMLKKSQVRSYGYMEDAFDQYLRKRVPSQEEIDNLLRLSSKFEVIIRAMQNDEVKIQDLRLSELVYFVNEHYYIW